MAPGWMPLGSKKKPRLRETPVILPPHCAVHVPCVFSATQSSHMVSVAGCHTTRCLSLPAATCASRGSGTPLASVAFNAPPYATREPTSRTGTRR